MDLQPGRGFAELDALYRDSHWRAELDVGQRFRWGGAYAFGWTDDSRAAGAGIGVTW